LRQLTTAIDGLDQRAADHFGINRTDLRCLDVLRSTGPTTPTELAAAVGMTSGGLSLALDRVERAGYVTRRPNPLDRRSVVIEATAELSRVEREVFGPVGRRMKNIVARYSDEQLEAIEDFLERVTEVAVAQSTPPGTHRTRNSSAPSPQVSARRLAPR
jgi:DNA-binding MarR family transcriptional regulator